MLLDDDFGSVVKAIRLGRRIYDNLRKAIGFILAVHVPIAGLALLPLIFGLPLILGPVHIALLEMVIDPVCTLVFEAEIRKGHYAPAAARAGGTARLSYVNALERVARNIRLCSCGNDLHNGFPPRYAGNRESSTRFLFARDCDFSSHLCQSKFQRVGIDRDLSS